MPPPHVSYRLVHPGMQEDEMRIPMTRVNLLHTHDEAARISFRRFVKSYEVATKAAKNTFIQPQLHLPVLAWCNYLG